MAIQGNGKSNQDKSKGQWQYKAMANQDKSKGQ